MNNSTSSNKLLWKDEYSVNVKEIDDQHKQLFDVINNLIQVINTTPKEETIKEIIGEIAKYKAAHFATEEKYFHQFNFAGTTEHEAAHKMFNQKVGEIQSSHTGDIIALAFALIDFLEDWLLEHLVNMDQKYKQCFKDNGLS